MRSEIIVKYLEEHEPQVFDDFYDYEANAYVKCIIEDQMFIEFHIKENDSWTNRTGTVNVSENKFKSFIRENKLTELGI